MIVVIGCGKEKSGLRAEAWYLYRGALFWSHKRLANALRPRGAEPLELRGKFVVSAKYGLVEAGRVIETYDLKRSDLSAGERERWDREVAAQVDAVVEPGELVVVLAGRDYSAWTKFSASRISDLLEGMTLGERRGAIRRMLEGERLCQAFDRGNVRERLAAMHEHLLATDPEYVKNQQEIERCLARISKAREVAEKQGLPAGAFLMRIIITPKPVVFGAGHELRQFCTGPHGHTYKVEIDVEGELELGVVADFAALRGIVKGACAGLRNGWLNDKVDNPTAERVAIWLWGKLEPEIRRAHSAELVALRLYEGEHRVEVRR